MPGLADLILSAPEPDISCPELEQQLEELRARKLGGDAVPRSGGYGVPQSGPTSPVGPVDRIGATGSTRGPSGATGRAVPVAPAMAHAVAENEPRGTSTSAATAADAKEATRTVAALSAPGSKRGGPRSLADEILQRSAVGDVDSELQSMEKELQQKLSEYRQQREGSANPAAPSDVAARHSRSSADARVAQPKAVADARVPASRGSIDARPAAEKVDAPAGATDSDGFGGFGQDGATSAPELAKLQEEAAQMDAVFPEAAESLSENAGENPVEGSANTLAYLERRRQLLAKRSALERPGRKAAAPLDEGVLDLRSALDGLDARLNALQEQKALHAHLQPLAAPDDSSSAAARAIREIRAQNDHLRERLGVNEGQGILGLDRSLFGAAPSTGADPLTDVES
mmetsp:Transcript_76013/g.211184  ORF Transcript_76013/g.211184 Transcript_76013/m.211184 type:complete len:401 (-) Transcript_76013:31-1233(-)